MRAWGHETAAMSVEEARWRKQVIEGVPQLAIRGTQNQGPSSKAVRKGGYL
jgi:hypothetical protein